MADIDNQTTAADNVKQAASEAANIASGVADATSAVGKAMIDDIPGAVKDGVSAASKLMKPIIAILISLFCIVLAFLLFLQSVPALIWNGVTKSITEWQYTHTISAINECYDSYSTTASNDIVNYINSNLPKGTSFENLRNEFYKNPSGTRYKTENYVFSIEKDGEYTVVYYQDLHNLEVTEIYIKGLNENTYQQLDYSAFINAYIQYRENSKKDKEYDDKENSDVKNENEGKNEEVLPFMEKSSLGLIDTARLKHFLNKSENMPYEINTTQLQNISKVGEYPHYQCIIEFIDKTNSENYIKDLFKLSDEDMEQVNFRTACSNGFTEILNSTIEEQNIDSVKLFSISKETLLKLLNGHSVMLQRDNTSDKITEEIIREAFVNVAYNNYSQNRIVQSFLNAEGANYMGVTNNEQFKQKYKVNATSKNEGDVIKNPVSLGDPGMFILNCLLSEVDSTGFTFAQGLNMASEKIIAYDAETYFNVTCARNIKNFFNENLIETSNLDTINVNEGDLICFENNNHNYGIGVVLGEKGNSYNMLVYNYNFTVNSDYNGMSTFFDDHNNMAFIENYQTSVFDDSDTKVIGVIKIPFSKVAQEYNNTFAQVSPIAPDDDYTGGSGILGYPTPKEYRKHSASYPNYSSGKYHGGIDFPCPVGTPVYASEDGEVVKVKKKKDSYGYYFIIKHDNGYYTLCAHNSELLIEVGQRVKKGEIVARSGNTGNSTGPHVHFEVRTDISSNKKYRCDPRKFLQQ